MSKHCKTGIGPCCLSSRNTASSGRSRIALRHTIAVLLIVISILLLNKISTLYPDGYGVYKREIENQFALPGVITDVSIGNSTASAIDFSELCKGGRDFHYPGNDLFGSEAILSLLLDRYPSLKTVYLSINRFSLTQDNGAKGSEGIVSRKQVYRLLSDYGKKNLIGGDWQNALIGWYMPIVRDDRWKFPIALVLSNIVDLNIPRTSEDRWRQYQDKLLAEEIKDWDGIKRTLTIRANLTSKIIKRNRYYDPTIQYRCADVLLRIQKKLKNRQIEFIVFSPPIPELISSYLKIEDPSYKQFYKSTLNMLRDNGTLVLEYDNDPRYYKKYELFKDAWHLNDKGRKYFTKQLKNDLREKGKRCSVD